MVNQTFPKLDMVYGDFSQEDMITTKHCFSLNSGFTKIWSQSDLPLQTFLFLNLSLACTTPLEMDKSTLFQNSGGGEWCWCECYGHSNKQTTKENIVYTS